jgi:CheY-like chemotaxis protein
VPGTRRPVVLTVDDNRGLHEVYTPAFERDYEHVRAYGGEEALEIVRGKTIDVMVLDLRMPGLHGMEVLEQAFRLPSALVISEPVDFARLFREIATLLPPDPESALMKPLSAASSKAVERAVARYADHTVRVAHLSAGTGLSADHFAHVFREEMGLPPME